MATKIRCTDEVIVLTGKYKGKRGIVIAIYSLGKAIVSGINIVKKHQKPVPALNKTGGIIEKESVIHISNLTIFNTKMNQADRVSFKTINGKKVRVFKSNGQTIN
ncbi:50S ribosomal protein L24 [Candidatus Palibaumannia cicadellinicola]|uniref:Large ribosomal subunit protein uL24 n=1 Tax=Baumannia cicadellinicola subsp. Homalodisca coagulata TaxID=374463 RepID=RL24_BAUCH|nr:50S ribosomal protein L24 [Candidatus Baumannia cicadellinicola]Q1LTC7.1 RecName: Full=Large ribosomal subunit protein uL24; AltName: Full=50S ribosomal protein L24 [Baumannia cicadellinicola str. Hc (Homalodisca coagulata)]ABF14190.1 ribosomal protein L24 [Baumannia cicadellinicola str. Hc (Homalodisca coagulata)]MCJ7462231.1 50S ribosomal protein L24 [Candidatus Baumannia cicadellinicola]MCJ7462749.1 50S ribosomal protein L24 [Candidatus Baumannia cicadellinicola]